MKYLFLTFVCCLFLICCDDLETDSYEVPADFIESITLCTDSSIKGVRKGEKQFELVENVFCDYYDNGLVSNELHYNSENYLTYERQYYWNSERVVLVVISYDQKSENAVWFQKELMWGDL